MIEIREMTNVADAIRDNEALGRLHYAELATNKALMHYAPDIEKYRLLEEHGALVAVGAYQDGVQIGYSINMLHHHLHYKDLLIANNDMLFVAKDNRLGTTGLKLIKATVQICRERGAGLMLWHAKENTTLAKLLPKLGYRVQDIIFSEVL